jgi:hypothetical protein
MSEESLTLGELLVFRSTLELKAARLRQALHELRRARPAGWQQEFDHQQSELITTAGSIGRLSHRIHWWVRGKHDNEGIVL